MSQPPPDKPPGTEGFPFTPQNAIDFMQKMWNPFGMPMPAFGIPGLAPGATPGGAGGAMPFPNPAAMFAALDPAEVERKIGELRVIEGWLQMSLGMMQMSIKTMELQKASLEALRSAQMPQEPPKPEHGRKKT
jgi:hypothetical protein